jgi:hypothetical protein
LRSCEPTRRDRPSRHRHGYKTLLITPHAFANSSKQSARGPQPVGGCTALHAVGNDGLVGVIDREEVLRGKCERLWCGCTGGFVSGARFSRRCCRAGSALIVSFYYCCHLGAVRLLYGALLLPGARVRLTRDSQGGWTPARARAR